MSLNPYNSAIQPIQWLIEDYIELDSLSLVYGAPGGGKSFVTVGMACCVSCRACVCGVWMMAPWCLARMRRTSCSATRAR